MMKLAPKMSSTQPLPCNDDDRSSLRHRFVRLNPRFHRDETLALLKVCLICNNFFVMGYQRVPVLLIYHMMCTPIDDYIVLDL